MSEDAYIPWWVPADDPRRTGELPPFPEPPVMTPDGPLTPPGSPPIVRSPPAAPEDK